MTVKSITVKLRVVGIYFKDLELVVDTHSPCVEDVMKAASAKDPDFGYIKAKADPSLKAAYYTHRKAFVSDGGSDRKAGFYYLEDDLGINPIKTWQWYIVKSDGSTFNFGNDFVAFSIPVAEGGYEVQDGDQIIWRLLSIITDPIELTPRGLARLDYLKTEAGEVMATAAPEAAAAAGTTPSPVALPIDDATKGKKGYYVKS